MPIYEDQYFKDYVNSLPAATENDLSAGNNMPLVRSDDVKKFPAEVVAKQSSLGVISAPFSLNGYYSSGVLFPSATNSSNSTELIDISSASKILYTGSMGERVACWFDEDRVFIAMNVTSNGVTLVNKDVMPYKPENAKYVAFSSRNQNASMPPTATPSVSVYLQSGVIPRLEAIEETLNPSITNDGSVDVSDALQSLIDSSSGVVNLPKGVFLINKQLNIDTAKINEIHGNNTTIKINGSVGGFSAFNVLGSLAAGMSANPSSLDPSVISNEAATIIDGVRFTSTIATAGTAIRISGCMSPIVKDCYFYKMKNAIIFQGYNRNVMITGNNIYAMDQVGIAFTSLVNLHQCNIANNHISYCRRCIDFENCEQLANFQITGNDIELSSYPSDSQSGFRCIRIAGCTGLCSEFEIVGNTLQAHYSANRIIDIQGVSGNRVYNVSITGNQISNAAQNLVYLAWVHNVSCSGNTLAGQLADSAGSTYYLANNCDNVSISGDCVRDGSCFVEAAETSRINRLSVVNIVSVENAGAEFFVKINNAYAHGVQCSGNVLERGKVQIKSQDLNFVSVCNNTCLSNFAQDIGSCPKLKIENNL